MKRMRTILIAVVGACLLACAIYGTNRLSNNDELGQDNVLTSEQQELYSALKEAQDRREALYGNGHFVWHQTDTVGKESVVTKYEYWARDNRLFRLDTCNLVNGKQSGPIRRLIDRPEGTTLIEASTELDTGGVVATSTGCVDGSCAPGPTSISGQYFVAHANRLATLQVKDWIARWIDGEYEIASFEIISNSPTTCRLAFTRNLDAGTKSYEVDLDPRDFKVRSWTYEFLGRDDGNTASDEGTIEYGAANPDVPSSEQGCASSNFEDATKFECQLVTFALGPAEAGVFAIPDSVQGGE